MAGGVFEFSEYGGEMIIRTCPITRGLPTKMLKARFLEMCACQIVGENEYCAVECQGKKKPAELEFIELNREESGVAKQSGACEQCGKLGVSNLVKSHGKLCCPGCGVLRSGVKNHIEVVRGLIVEFFGEQEEQASVPTGTFVFPDLEVAKKILDCRETETIADAATRQMQRLYRLDPLYHESQEEIKELIGQINQDTPKEEVSTNMGGAISQACIMVRDFLLAKNESYGNSAADPVRIFSQADPLEQINVRIDDKLSRLIRGGGYPGDDDEQDLLGYLMLKRAVRIYHAEQARMAA